MGLSAGVAVIFVLPGLFFIAANEPECPAQGMEQGVVEKDPQAQQKKAVSWGFLVIGFITLVAAVHSFIGSEWFDVAVPGVPGIKNNTQHGNYVL